MSVTRKRLIWIVPAFLILLAVIAFAVISFQSVNNYEDLEGPKFEGAYSPGNPDFSGELKVVTWNIAFANDIDQAIQDFQGALDLQDADIILLQEMDETGTDTIARTLGYNYVYYPASIHTRHNRNFGNAVLSKWPIRDSEKIILPHRSPKNDQIRIAVRALLEIDGLEIPVYSVHTETIWLDEKSRADQIVYLAEIIESDEPNIIVGGDFNTFTLADELFLTNQMATAGLSDMTGNIGNTFGLGRVGLMLDHIFARGMTPLDAGIWQESDASDHHPIWATMQINPTS